MTSNAPAVDIGGEALCLLRDLALQCMRGYPARPSRSAARDELKRRELIESRPLGFYKLHTRAGHNRYWLPTSKGRELLAYLDS